MKFYHYVHCPFCIRVRMVLSFLDIEFESIVLPYEDESTPIELAGKKMLPIMDFGDIITNESLDIIEILDPKNILKTQESIQNYDKLEPLLNDFGKSIHSMAMPYFIWTQEFSSASREYFQKKKEKKRGPFRDLVQNREQFEQSLFETLSKAKVYFEKTINKDTLVLDDILLASHLWAMYIVPEFQYPQEVHNYLQSIKSVCNFEYHKDHWSK